MTTVTEKQLKTINYCLTDFRDRKTYEITSFLPALLDDLLIPTSIGMEMSAVYIDCDVDQDGLPDNLKNTKGITLSLWTILSHSQLRKVSTTSQTGAKKRSREPRRSTSKSKKA